MPCINGKIYRISGQYQDTTAFHSKGDSYNQEIITRCGYCSNCVKAKSENWIVRCHYAFRRKKNVLALVLTYNEQENTGLIDYSDFQLFMKKLRIILSRKFSFKNPIKHFSHCEYGSLKGRPHIHVILEGIPPEFDLQEILSSSRGAPWLDVYITSTLSDIWGKGLVFLQYANTDKALLEYMGSYYTKNKNIKNIVDNTNFEIRKYNDELRDYLADLPFTQTANRESLKKEFYYRKIREQNHSSLGLGWPEFESLVLNFPSVFYDKLKLGDYTYHIPVSWLLKAAELNTLYAARYKALQEKTPDIRVRYEKVLTLKYADAFSQARLKYKEKRKL